MLVGLFAGPAATSRLAQPAVDGQIALPALSARVTDLTGTLSASEKATLETRLAEFERRKGSQIAVLILPTTGPESIEEYSLRVVERWKLGRANVDDGILLIVAKDDRKLRLEVGYGLEGAVPDAIAKRIISDIITPRFKRGEFYGGIYAGLTRLIRIVDGEPLPPLGELTGRPVAAEDRTQESWFANEDNRTIVYIFGAVILIFVTIFVSVFWGTIPAAIMTGMISLILGLVTLGLSWGIGLAVVELLFLWLVNSGNGIGGGSSGSYSGSSSGWSTSSSGDSSWGSSSDSFSGGSDSFSGGGGDFGGGGASGDW